LSKYHSYLNSAGEILSHYQGEQPFASFIKKYFTQYKKFGSRDRKQVSHLCYCYFRLGKAFVDMPVLEKIITGLFLCSHSPEDMLEELKPEWNKIISLSVKEKLAVINKSDALQSVFPWTNEMSAGADAEEFCLSFFIQPELFLRIRPGKEATVFSQLEKAAITFKKITDTCIALPASSKIDALLSVNKEVVVQDYNSQRVGELMELVRRGSSDIHPVRRRPSDIHPVRRRPSDIHPVRRRPSDIHPVRRRPSDRVWDCCAASGGKSIMANDILGNIDLTVSDVRESILVNLGKRFRAAGIINYKSFVADISDPQNLPAESFDFIIADVPCTGSGTWSRTPEQLYYFDTQKIADYAALQRKIVGAAVGRLEKGGYFLYITCSVFRKENEEVVDFIKEKLHLQPVKMEFLKGYDKRADTMFAALLQLPL
jgi:16S rRNA (cytosine967-C5)-methyltransferase